MMITYRDAGVEDAATLDRIFDTVFSGTFGHLYRAEDLESFLSSFGVADWEAQLGDPAFAFRIAEADGEPVGYVKLGPMKLHIETNRQAMLLDHFYVLQAHHGAGIAQTLMDWPLEAARHRRAEELYLTVF